MKKAKRPLWIITITAGVLLLAAAAYAVSDYYSQAAPTATPTVISTAIENTNPYYYTDNGDAPEKAAYELAVLFMDDLKSENKARTFRITEYKDLAVSIEPTTQIDDETAAIYGMQDREISENTWIVEIAATYKYEGIISPIGPANGEWIDILYQGSPIGFLLTKDRNTYSLRSRYR